MERERQTRPVFVGVDIGNTHTVIGLFRGYRLVRNWRIRTDKRATADELGVLLRQFCALVPVQIEDIEDLILCCVVPPVLHSWEGMCRNHMGTAAMIVQNGEPLGMPVKYSRPHEVGADRLVNAIAAYSRFRQAVIAVDYGTATTFDCISASGEYLGGAIAPGLLLAAEALFQGTSRLPRVELFARPRTALGQDTVSAIQAGMIYGFAGLTGELLRQLFKEFPEQPRVIATGGLAPVVAPYCPLIEEVFPDLTLEGLAIIYKKFKGAAASEPEPEAARDGLGPETAAGSRP